jgi:DNA-directed RNA polymerase specialized sigma24 family protein
MTNSQRVSALYTKHHSWLIACAFNLTGNKDDAESLIQDVYLQLLEMPDLEKIIYNTTDLNLFYLYKIIKSKFLNNIKANQKLNKVALKPELIDTVAEEEYSEEEDENTEKLLLLVTETLSGSLHWFDSKLFTTYIEDDHSIQSLSDATKISKNAIFTSLRKTKLLIRKRAQDENLYS